MRPAVTHTQEASGLNRVLNMALELSEEKWVLAFTVGLGQQPRKRAVTGGDVAALVREVAAAKRRFRLSADARVVSCYEAGLEGFWLHRALVAQGIENRVVDSSSIDVKRGRKHAKTDRLDAGQLVNKLVQYEAGDRKVWSVVRVPPEEAEDLRHNDRELLRLKDEQTAAVNAIKGLLKTQGVRLRGRLPDAPTSLEAVRCWDGSSLRSELKARLVRLWERLHLVRVQICEVEARRTELMAEATPAAQVARQLLGLKGLGATLSWTLTTELLGWRSFNNRREVGGLVGLAPVPYQSGSMAHDSGHAKTGRARLRGSLTELAWSWMRNQPESALTRWFERRYAGGGKRLRRIGIVAVSRKLLIELWKYVTTGALPEGALTKA
jgi:transposase